MLTHFNATPRLVAASLLIAICLLGTRSVVAQGIHFSQYYNSPMLVNPANAGLMSDRDYRIGANYRTQWGAVPVPFNTYSFYGDLQVFRGRNQTNWLGLGLAVFSDKGGDGNLSMNQFQGFLAYHIELGNYSMISFGASVAQVQRTVDFTKLTFDVQWDGFDFDHQIPSNESAVTKSKYTDVGAGLNFAFYPSEYFYLKAGVGVTHINQPRESFLKEDNSLGVRPSVNVDAIVKTENGLTINPSVYFTTQKGAYEFMYGAYISTAINESRPDTRVILGAYHRWNDAIVAAFGIEWHDIRIMGSYDYTISGLGQYINHNGAMEVGIRWMGSYQSQGTVVRQYACPRF